ncbi:hypothetical protein KKB83_03815 [Patescibacteria group bacterium]|nr:hypothetical protein [Patescibacteria group bacterium]
MRSHEIDLGIQSPDSDSPDQPILELEKEYSDYRTTGGQLSLHLYDRILQLRKNPPAIEYTNKRRDSLENPHAVRIVPGIVSQVKAFYSKLCHVNRSAGIPGSCDPSATTETQHGSRLQRILQMAERHQQGKNSPQPPEEIVILYTLLRENPNNILHLPPDKRMSIQQAEDESQPDRPYPSGGKSAGNGNTTLPHQMNDHSIFAEVLLLTGRRNAYQTFVKELKEI